MSIRTIIGVLAMAVSFASAQDVTPSIGAKSKGLLFNWSGLSTLGANTYTGAGNPSLLNTGGVGAKFFLSSALAVRGGLQFGYSNQTLLAPPTGGTDGSSTVLMYGVNAGAELHLSPSRVSPYVGGVINLSSTSVETKFAFVPPAAQATSKNGGGAGMNIGAGGLVGVEFFLTKEISLAAEYVLGYALTMPYDQEVLTPPTPLATTKFGSINSIRINTSGAVTLSVYF